MGFAEKEQRRRASSIVSKIIVSEEEKKTITADVVTPVKEEPRSKRVNLLIQPSVHEKAQKKCKTMDISLNECINQLLNSWLEQ